MGSIDSPLSRATLHRHQWYEPTHLFVSGTNCATSLRPIGGASLAMVLVPAPCLVLFPLARFPDRVVHALVVSRFQFAGPKQAETHSRHRCACLPKCAALPPPFYLLAHQ